MNNMRPKFLPSYLELLRKETEQSGLVALLPFKLAACVATGYVCSRFVLPGFWGTAKIEVTVAVYGGLLTFTGLLLALGWSAFSRMYETLFRAEFGAYLQEKGLLNSYIVHIGYMHFVQILSILFAGAGLVCSLLAHLPTQIYQWIFALTIGFTIYAIMQAIDAVSAMNDLAWQCAFFERSQKQSKSAVVPLRS